MWKYGVLQITLILAAFYFFGYVFGLAFLVAFIYAADFVLDKLGYQILNAGDLFMSFEAPGRNHNIGGYFLIKKIGFEEVKNEVYTKAVANLRRFRQIQVERLGFKFWMDISVDDCKDQVKKIDRKLKTAQECADYTAELLDEYMDYSKPLWEFHVLEDYSKEESLVIVKMHHSFTDGVGFVSIMCLMNDEENKFKMAKVFKEATIATKIKRLLMTPYFIISTLIKYKFYSSDKNTERMNDLNGKDITKNHFFMSDFISFEDIQKCYKRFPKTTFNDYMLGMISKSFDKWFKAHNVEGASKILTAIPINMRPLPNDISEFQPGNQITSIKFELPIHDNLQSGISDAQKAMKSLKDEDFVKAMTNFFKIIPIMPEVLSKYLYNDYFGNVHLMFSNVPFSDKPWFFCNKEVVDFGAFASTHLNCRLFLVVITYKKKAKIFAMTNGNLKMDLQKYIDTIYNEIINDVAQNAKKD